MDIRVDDLTGSQIAEMVAAHLQGMKLNTPPESVHALDLEGLRSPEVTFWSVWEGTELIGCGALKELDAHHAEIKSMRTASSHLRKGVASRLLHHLLDEARRRGYRLLSLETSSMDSFEPARRLYAKFGFRYCEAFGDYKSDPNSAFMAREI
jgi:putative acetyltransferase